MRSHCDAAIALNTSLRSMPLSPAQVCAPGRLFPDQPAVKDELIIAKRCGPISEADQTKMICDGRECLLKLCRQTACAWRYGPAP
jgi:hypothetical protein